MNRTHRRPLRLLLATAVLLCAGSSASFALDTINVSYPSPAPFYIPVAVAIHQGFFREQNLDVKLIVTRAEVDRAVDAMASFLKTDREIADGVYQLAGNNFTKDGMLDDAGLKPLVNDQLAGVNPKDTPLAQPFDFSLLQQVLKEGR